MKHEEHQNQAALVKWWAQQRHPAVLFAIPNAAQRSVGLAAYMKAEGLVAGVPDLFFAWPTVQHSGLFIEMKTGKGRLTGNQKSVISALEASGYKVVVARGWKEAAESIKEYLENGRQQPCMS